MFGFEELYIYKVANSFNLAVRDYLRRTKIDYPSEDQLRRASLSIVLNIAEGSGRYSDLDKRRFYIMSRSSVLECAAILLMLKQESQIDPKLFSELYTSSESLSKLLYVSIEKLIP